MISEINKIIYRKLSSEFDLPESGLDFLKYNTPISGSGIGTKLLFFVFKPGYKAPILTIKTIRNSRDYDVITRGYDKLVKLNDLVNNSEFQDLFPKPLLINEDAENHFSVETFKLGRKATFKDDFEKIWNKYISLSKYLKSKSKSNFILNAEYGRKIINQLEGDRPTLDSLEKYLDKLWQARDIELPVIPQHGDLTIDNILILGDNISIVDCDIFGDIFIPGFDIFHLLSRNKSKNIKDLIKKYFDEVDIKCDFMNGLFFIFFLHGLLIKKDYILKGESGESIIKKFESIVF